MANEPGKGPDRRKGVRVEAASTYIRENGYSQPDDHTPILNKDEARNLSTALTYMRQANQT